MFTMSNKTVGSRCETVPDGDDRIKRMRASVW